MQYDHIDPLLKTLINTQTVCLTPNLRLCHHLQLAHALNLQKQHCAWESLPIFPIRQWLDQLWAQYSDDKIVCLSEQQELCLWQQCMSQKNQSQHEHYQQTKLAQSAWATLHTHRVSLHDITEEQHLGFNYFKQAALAFRARCQSQSWITESEKITQLIELLEKKSAKPSTFLSPPPILLLNFDEQTPALKHFFTLYNNYNTVQPCDLKIQPDTIDLHEFEQTDDEITAMASFAYKHWRKDPSKKIACVVPHLNQTRPIIEKIFLKKFQPSPAPLNTPEPELPFNLSVGRTLYDYPIIQLALSALTLAEQELDLASLHALWQSPYLQADIADRFHAAALEQTLAQLPSVSLDLQQLTKTITKHSNPTSDATLKLKQADWNQRWINHLNLLNKPCLKKNRSDWFNSLYHELQQLGWPGYRTLTSADYQILKNFLHLLEQNASADLMGIRLSRQQYLQDIQEMCREHVFQIQSTTPAPIQILGSLEAAGSLYDTLWISDLHAEQWPASACPHPFLPAGLQREHQMPHASAEREYDVSSRLLSRLIHSATAVHLSYAKRHQDIPQTASALIIPWRQDSRFQTHADPISASGHQYTELQAAYLRKTYQERPLAALKSNQHIGGSTLLKDQSLCPFKGFAHWRLCAKPLHKIQYGIGAKQKGIILHAALQYLWEQLKSQKELKELLEQSEPELQKIISQSISKAVDQTLDRSIPTLHFIRELESFRLQEILNQWCTIEKERNPFTVISCEGSQTITLSGIKLKLRIDRIDRIDHDLHSDYRIIDYKSGTTKWQHWFGDRIQDPQLPLYCFNQNLPIKSICYANLKTGKLNYVGISSDDNEDSGIKTLQERKKKYNGTLPTDWNDCLIDWKNKLEKILSEFTQGEAHPNPAASEICDTCSLQTLCRIKHHAS